MRRNDRKRVMGKIARERVMILLQQALEAYKRDDPELAKRYTKLAHKIRLRYRVKLKKDTRLKYCKKCFLPWIPGETVQVRVAGKRSCVEYRCRCGYIKRFGY